MNREKIEKHIQEQISKSGNNNLKSILRELEKHGGTYVITDSNEIKFLIAACSTNEDYYYVYLTYDDNGEFTFKYTSCVGYFIPLHENLPNKDYNLLTDKIIELARIEHKKDLLKYIKDYFDISNENVLFTPIYI